MVKKTRVATPIISTILEGMCNPHQGTLLQGVFLPFLGTRFIKIHNGSEMVKKTRVATPIISTILLRQCSFRKILLISPKVSTDALSNVRLCLPHHNITYTSFGYQNVAENKSQFNPFLMPTPHHHLQP